MMSAPPPDPRKMESILRNLKAGRVDDEILSNLAVGITSERRELLRVLGVAQQGPSAFKFLRADPRSGRTVFARLIGQDARTLGFVTTRISLKDGIAVDDPGALYRAAVAQLCTTSQSGQALGYLLKKVAKRAAERPNVLEHVDSDQVPTALSRAIREFVGLDPKDIQGRGQLLSWMRGGPKVPPLIEAVKGAGPIRGAVAADYLGGLAPLTQAAGYCGLLLIVDDLEHLLAWPDDRRAAALAQIESWLNPTALTRRMVWLFIGGTEFFEGRGGIKSLPSLEVRARLVVDEGYRSLRQPQLVLPPWNAERLTQLATRLRDLYPRSSTFEPARELPDQELARLARGALEGQKAGQTAPHDLTSTLLSRLDQAKVTSLPTDLAEAAGLDPAPSFVAPLPPPGLEGDDPSENSHSDLPIVGAANRLHVQSTLSEVLENTRNVATNQTESTLGRYEILEHLGTGAGGLAFRARDPQTGDQRVLKVLSPALRQNATAVARFARETILARRINHPGVCQVFGLEEAEGVRFIVMEYVDGTNLGHLLKERAPLPSLAVAELGCSLADALAAAHDAGVIHRDLKPSNIMVRPSGDACILDFGVAISPTEPQARLTVPNIILGSRCYIAPELWQGEEATVRSDIFALGVVLYRAVTGKLPFDVADDDALVRAMKGTLPPPPSEVEPGCEDLDDALMRALAPRAADRFPSARAFEGSMHEIEATVDMDISGVDLAFDGHALPKSPKTLGSFDEKD